MTLIIYSIGNDTKLKRDAVLIYFYNSESIDIIYSIGNDTKLKRDAVLIYFYNTESYD